MNLDQAFQARLDWLDDYHLIVHKNDMDGGGGDTAQREGMFHFACASRFPSSDRVFSHYAGVVGRLEIEPGIWVRHPNDREWYGSLDNFSRDQFRATVMALGATGLRVPLRRLLWKTLLRFGFMTNTKKIHETKGWKIPDHLTYPSYWGEALRALIQAYTPRKWWGYLGYVFVPLWVTDVFLLLGSVWAAEYGNHDPGHSDDLNHIMALIQSHDVASTPIAWCARRYFAANRNPPAGYEGTWGPEACLFHYFRADGVPKIGMLYKELGVMEKLWK